MSVNQAAVELVFKARNLAEGVADDVAATVGKVGDAGVNAARRFGSAFAGIGSQLSIGIGMVTETLAGGGSMVDAAGQMGVFMAGQLAEMFSGGLIEKLASSSLVAAIAAPLGAVGSTIGGLIAAAIPIGMALLPVILIGALVAAITVLIVNPEIRGKVFDFVGGLVGKIGDFLRAGLGILADIIPKAFGAAWQLVVDGVKAYVSFVVDFWTKLPERLAAVGGMILRTIIDGLAGFPGRIADIIGGAFRSLKIDIGPFHISSSGVTIDLPKIDVPHFASGVQRFAGGLAKVGENGPELVRLPAGSDVMPAGTSAQLGGGAGGMLLRLEGVSADDILDIVDRGLYVRLRQAGITG